jgi:hypothetical protein
MKALIGILVIGAIIIGLPIVLFQYGGFTLLNDADPLIQYTVIGLFILPIGVAFLGTVSIILHENTYSLDEQFIAAEEMEAQEDYFAHNAVGLLIAIVQDFSHTTITEPSIYTPALLAQMKQELQRYQLFLERGYRLHFHFHHEEAHALHVLYALGGYEFVVEVDGIFDFYFEYGGYRYRSMLPQDTRQPLMRAPARFRIRMKKDEESDRWRVLGFSDNITGQEFGLATA